MELDLEGGVSQANIIIVVVEVVVVQFGGF